MQMIDSYICQCNPTKQINELNWRLTLVTSWMTQNFLKLNTTKTEGIIVGLREIRHKFSNCQISLNITTFATSNDIKNQDFR